MRTVVIISSITFVLIFGIIVVASGLLGEARRIVAPAPIADSIDREAADRMYRDLDVERDRVQRENELLAAMRLTLAAEAKASDLQRERLAVLIEDLQSTRVARDEESEREIQRLAKVYEAMKPAQAAPILAGMDLEVTLDVLRRMKERSAARILAAMNPGLAAELTVRMGMQGERG